MNDRIDVLVTQNRVYDANQTFVEDITPLISGAFEFSNAAQGGYAAASVSLACSEVKAWQVLSQFVGKRIKFCNVLAPNSSFICWEGMIYTVTVDNGKNAISRSLANVFNRVKVSFSTISFDEAGNAVLGEQESTGIVNASGSQITYGIRELNRVISGANLTDAEALRDVLLNQYKLPLAQSTAAQRGGSGSPGDVAVTIECVGWWETLGARFYTSTTTTEANIDTSIKACLTSVGQFVAPDQSNIVSNTRQKTQHSQGNITAQMYLNGLCALGGANSLRYYLQLRETARAYYFEEPTTVGYRARRLDPSEAIYDATTGLVVPPWLVQAGKIIEFTDLLPDALTYSSSIENARTMLIGEARFVAPGLLYLTPLMKDPAQIQLARMGLSEIG